MSACRLDFLPLVRFWGGFTGSSTLAVEELDDIRLEVGCGCGAGFEMVVLVLSGPGRAGLLTRWCVIAPHLEHSREMTLVENLLSASRSRLVRLHLLSRTGLHDQPLICLVPQLLQSSLSSSVWPVAEAMSIRTAPR